MGGDRFEFDYTPMQQGSEEESQCDFCKNHYKGDTLFESSDWDGGIGYDFIRDIKYCPLCGRELEDG